MEVYILDDVIDKDSQGSDVEDHIDCDKYQKIARFLLFDLFAVDEAQEDWQGEGKLEVLAGEDPVTDRTN